MSARLDIDRDIDRQIDRDSLATAVSRALDRPAIELSDWHVDALHAAFNQSTGGLYRLRGTACNRGDRGERVRWSLVLKILQASDGAFGGKGDPDDANYWKRELLIYRSGVTENLPGIRAPRCFGVEERDDSTAWLWMEDVRHESSSRWPLERYRHAARRLGEFNGAYLVGRPLPDRDSISRQWVRAMVRSFAEPFDQLPSSREHAMVRRCWPGSLLERMLELWRERELFLRALDELPQTFCHFDAWPRNLLVDSDRGEVVAVDWSYSGIGAVGAELAPMVAASVCFYDADVSAMRSIDDAVFGGYLEGIRSAGWSGSAALVRLGYTATASLRYALFPMGIHLLSDELRAHFERTFGRSAREIADRWVTLVGFLLDQADEARRLLRSS